MFERYTMRAKQAVFYARFEAGQAGARFLRAHHLLLGTLRADPGLARRFFGREDVLDALRDEVAAHENDPADIPVSQDMALDDAAKRVFASAAEESEREGLREIAAGHLLLGVMREEGPARQAMLRRGLKLAECRDKIREEPESPGFENPPEEILR